GFARVSLPAGVLLAACHALDNTTAAPPVAAAVRSHFNDCPDSHSQFCFHGTCRFLVQEDKPACVCHSGYVGTLTCVCPQVSLGVRGDTLTCVCPQVSLGVRGDTDLCVSPGVTRGTWGH
uniref:Transforming growth factor alpha n=1 Tax=Cyanistes caeruleus TaxID=156563 RepID=A0A8C0U9V2_CYACU